MVAIESPLHGLPDRFYFNGLLSSSLTVGGQVHDIRLTFEVTDFSFVVRNSSLNGSMPVALAKQCEEFCHRQMYRSRMKRDDHITRDGQFDNGDIVIVGFKPVQPGNGGCLLIPKHLMILRMVDATSLSGLLGGDPMFP